MNKKIHQKRKKRLEWLDEALRNSEGLSLVQLLELVNARMQEAFSDEQFTKLRINQRSLQEDLRMLKEGALDGKRRQLVFDKENQVYAYGLSKSDWTSSDISEIQSATLPFLFSILDPFKGIPAIDMVLDDVALNHNLVLEEYQSDWTAVTHQLPSPDLQNRLNNMLTTIMQYIKGGKAIEFEYSYVKYGPNRENMATSRRVYPMQIRMWNGRYFLVSIPIDTPELVKTYALDGVKNGDVRQVLDHENQPILFSHKKLAKQMDIKGYLKHSIGVFRDSLNDAQPVIIKQWFIASAAASVLAVPLHQSQKVLQVVGNAVLLSFHIYHNAEWEATISKYGNLTWNNDQGVLPNKHTEFLEF